MFLMGVFGFAGVPGMITRVTDYAHGAALAASANVSASNVGNALGAWLGGLAITAGLGYTAPLYVGAGIVLTAVVVMAVAAHRARPAGGQARESAVAAMTFARGAGLKEDEERPERGPAMENPQHVNTRPAADTEPQTAAGKVLWHFTMSLDGFVAGPDHAMDWMTGSRPGPA